MVIINGVPLAECHLPRNSRIVPRVPSNLRQQQLERDQNFRLNDFNLLDEIRPAGLHFTRRGRPIAEGTGRCVGPAFQNISDVDFFPGEAHRLNNSGEQLTCAPNKWFALFVLISAGCFADEHQFCIRISYAETVCVREQARCGHFVQTRTRSNRREQSRFIRRNGYDSARARIVRRVASGHSSRESSPARR